MEVPFNDLTKQWAPLKPRIMERFNYYIDNSRFVGGTAIRSAEEKLCRVVNSLEEENLKHAILCSSGTAALTVIIKALHLPPGSNIAVQANTFHATAFAVINAGHNPVLIDKWKDIENVHEKYNIKCAIPVHMFGCVRMDEMPDLKEYCSFNGIPIIEDACQAIGVKTVGTWGVAAAISFYPGKNLGAWGQAGAIVTNSDPIETFARAYIQQGYDKYGDPVIPGDNLRCDSLQAIVLDEGLDYIDLWNSLRERIAKQYLDTLEDLKKKHSCILHFLRGNNPNSWHLFPVLPYSSHERSLMRKLKNNNIGFGRHYSPQICETPWGSKLPIYPESSRHRDNTRSLTQKCGKTVSLPIYPSMTQEQIDAVINIMDEI